jgi:hypothetical protein
MVEGPMNVAPSPVEVEVETTQSAEENVAKQQTGIADLPAAIEVPKGATAHFPTPKPRLTAGGQTTLARLRGH